jgi:hypothetical protein
VYFRSAFFGFLTASVAGAVFDAAIVGQVNCFYVFPHKLMESPDIFDGYMKQRFRGLKCLA